METTADMLKKVDALGTVADHVPDLFKRQEPIAKSRYRGLATFIVPKQDPVHVFLEVADTPDTRFRGLMGRKRLPDHCGMIFIELTPRGCFWMHGCHIPLDIVFLNKESRVTRIYTMWVDGGEDRYPYDDEDVAIEMPAGFCLRHGIEVGTKCKWRTWGTWNG